MFVVKSHDNNSDALDVSDMQSENNGSAYVYNEVIDSWTICHGRFHAGANNRITNTITTPEGKMMFLAMGSDVHSLAT